MRRSRTLAAIAVTSVPFVVSLLPAAATSFETLFAQTVQNTSSTSAAHDSRLRTRFTPSSSIAVETRSLSPVAPTEAPAGFDNLTNGFEPQEQFDADRAVFDE